MLDLFKKIGLPATVAAIIASLITIVPFLFKLDERYAKAKELDDKIKVVETQINDLSVEVGKIVGTQQVLVAVLSNMNTVSKVEAAPAPIWKNKPLAEFKIDMPPDESVAPIKATPGGAPAPIEAVKLKEISKSLVEQQQRVKNIYQNPSEQLKK